jgi:hypothetical protein
MMLSSIDMAQWQFSSARMIKEYYDVIYVPVFQAQGEITTSPYVFNQVWLEEHPQPYGSQ